MDIIKTVFWLRKPNIPYVYTILCDCGFQREILAKRYNKNINYCVSCKNINNHLVSVYKNIISRCYNENDISYSNYWGRWIICTRDCFLDFYNDMCSSYQNWLMIERIDNDWNYCKENCKRANRTEQNRNTRSNIKYKWKCVSEVCEKIWVNPTTIYKRVKRWRSIKEAVETEIRYRKW